MPTQIPDTTVCLGCGYPLRGLPDSVCPECGRGFDVDDPSTYRSSETAQPLRLTPAVLGGTGLAVYMGCLFVLGRLDPGTVKGAVSMSIQPVLMVAGTALSLFAVGWAWRRREQRIGTMIVAAVLLLIIFTIHLPSYVACLEDIAAVRADFQPRASGKP